VKIAKRIEIFLGIWFKTWIFSKANIRPIFFQMQILDQATSHLPQCTRGKLFSA